jgi:anti-anti-sigma regulatory factor
MRKAKQEMLKISIFETRSRRRLVLEGTLVHPWTAELEQAWTSAEKQVEARKLVVDLTNVTLISGDGEEMLLKLMRSGVKFSARNVLTKYVLKQLARRCRGEL